MMNRRLGAICALLALCLAGCVPFVLESPSAHFAPGEYSPPPLADGLYVLDGHPKTSAKVVAGPDHVAITMTQDNGDQFTMIGGFVALGTPGYFIFQVTDANENGKTPDNKKPGETTYLPVRASGDGGVANWFPGPDRSDPEINELLRVHGFDPRGDGEWVAPKTLSRAQLLAFYEQLAPRLDRTGWAGMKMLRVAKS
jgi:hypothetical protein